MPGHASGASSNDKRRSQAVDIARGLAILAMIVFHFVRDLEMFQVIAAGTTLTGGWAFMARAIASSFLFLVGVSLVLAHPEQTRWAAFGRRFLIISAAALLVSLASWAAMPERFIYFGILHAIAFASVLGIVFVRASAWVAAAVAIAILGTWFALGRGLPLNPWWGWTGLAMYPRPALDLIPVFPWLAAAFLGIAFAKTLPLPRSNRQSGQVAFAMSWLGRHSLPIYLLHQPVLIGSIWLVLRLVERV
jgi:uncharacterized membrane protein